MKYTIEGFSQEYALTLTKQVEEKGKLKTVKVDCIDLIILRWFVDFYPKMTKVEIEGAQYAWLNYKKLLEDMPLLDIGKHMLANRLQKLCDFGILTHKNIKYGGNFSYYGFGANYHNLIEKPCATDEHLMQDNAKPCAINCTTLVQNNAEPCAISCNTNNSSTKDPSTKDPSLNIKGKHKAEIVEIIDYLNRKIGSHYRPDNEDTVNKLTKILGKYKYTVEDCKKAIDNMASAWIGTEFEQYLRPSTIFNGKFESYLNWRAKPKQKPKQEEKHEMTIEEWAGDKLLPV